MSRIRTNLITNRMANGAPTVSNGLVISGVTTSTNVTSAIDAIIKNTVHDCELQILATYSNKNSKLLFGDAADDDVGMIDYDHNTNNMKFYVNASQSATIDSSGNLGLNGITSPSSYDGWARQLVLGSTTGHGGLTIVSGNDDGEYGHLLFADGTGGSPDQEGGIGYHHYTNHMYFRTNNSERVRITNTGQLLVNTTSASISSAELFEVKSTSTGFSHFRNNSSTYAPIYIDNEASNDGATLVPLITFTDGGGNRAGFLLNNSSQFDISASGSLNFSTGNNVGSATQRMRILGDGRVLINTSDGAAFSSRKLTISDITGGGTTAMEIRSATNGTGRIYFTDSTSSSDAGSYAGKVYYDHLDDHMAFYTGGGTNTPGARMKIDAYGRVTKPNQPLFVVQKSAAITGTGFVTFNTVIENVGSHYNSSNGRFTAPIAGYYWFCCKINAYKRIDFFLKRNGQNSPNTHREIGQFNTSNQDGWYSHNLIRIFELAANDYVQVDVTNIYQNSDPGEWITFQGYLLQ